MCTRTRRKEQWPHKWLTQTCQLEFRSFREVMGRQWPAASWGHCSAQQCLHGTFWGGHHYLYYLHNNLDSDQTTGREHSPAHQQKIGLNIYWAWSCPSEQDPIFPSVSLSHQEASISLLSFSIRGQTEWKPQSQKINQTDHMDHSLI